MKRLLPALMAAAVMMGMNSVSAQGLSTGQSPVVGFSQDSRILSFGLLHGGSLVGVDFEYGMSYNWGLQLGLGVGGANAALNLHLTSDATKDLYFSGGMIYWPWIHHLFLPQLGFGMRWFPAASHDVGIAFEMGSAFALKSVSREIRDRTIEIEEYQFVPRAALGVVFRLE